MYIYIYIYIYIHILHTYTHVHIHKTLPRRASALAPPPFRLGPPLLPASRRPMDGHDQHYSRDVINM